MFTRYIEQELLETLADTPVVTMLGARQTGKTTLVKSILDKVKKTAVYLDLESDEDRHKLDNAEQYLSERKDQLIIMDEVQRYPDLFPLLRSLVDRHRVPGRFLLLGSASPELLMRSAETLVGRIAFLYLQPLNFLEIQGSISQSQHWLRGGFPDMLLAKSDTGAFRKLNNFVQTYTDRELPLLGMGADFETRRNLMRLLASVNSAQINLSDISRSLGYSVPTIKNYLGFIENAFLTYRLQPWFVNTGKRLSKNAKLHFTDSGMVHSLSGIGSMEELAGNIVLGGSFESYITQQVRACIAPEVDMYYYRTSNGAEIDILLAKGSKPIVGIEVKYGTVPKVKKGTYIAKKDLGNIPLLVVCNTSENYSMDEDVHCVNLMGMFEKLDKLNLLRVKLSTFLKRNEKS
jgi:predicted AAA+ superfamily ATPase